jgi:site-specific DNA-cytosine methylase
MHSELCPSLKARDAKGPSSDGDGDGAILVPMVQPIATHDVAGTMLSRKTSGGFSNSIDHAAAGYMALQPIPLDMMNIRGRPSDDGRANRIGRGYGEVGDPMFTITKANHHGVAQPIAYALDSLASNSMKSANLISGCNEVDISKALDTSRGLDPSCNQGGMAVAQPIPFDTTQITSPQNGNNPKSGDPCHPLAAGAHPPAIVAPTLTAANDPSRSPQSSEVTNQVYSVLQASMAVRRLSPKECERLQGFPDAYTDIKPKGKATPDGPRYKALGNSMAVPVMAWIGKRIQEVDAICQTQKQ